MKNTKNNIEIIPTWFDEFVENTLNRTDFYLPTITVQSMGRPNCTTLQHICECSELDIKVYVYPDEVDAYKSIWDKYDNIEVVAVNVPVKGLSHKRNFVVNDCHNKGIKHHFQMDDDFTWFGLAQRTYNTESKNLRTGKYDVKFDTFIKVWSALLFDHWKINPAISGLINPGFQFSADISVDGPECHRSFSKFGQLVLIDTEQFINNNIVYDQTTYEDTDAILQCAKAGLDAQIITLLTAGFIMFGGAGAKNQTGGLTNDYANNDWSKKLTQATAKKWPRYVKEKHKAGTGCWVTQVNWVRIRKDIEKYGTLLED